jgi:DNA (cytosine-5)-methyltransferase 1
MPGNAPEVVDLFCGVGALSHGLKLAGCKIVAGYDVDSRCKYAFETNNGGTFYARDVSKLLATEIAAHFTGAAPSVLAGCAPCQPFSSYKQRYAEDPQWGLVQKFADLAVEVAPDYVTMENVPALLKYQAGALFSKFRRTLEEAGYDVVQTVAKCELFGVPQRRRRLVVLASRRGKAPRLIPSSSGYLKREAVPRVIDQWDEFAWRAGRTGMKKTLENQKKIGRQLVWSVPQRKSSNRRPGRPMPTWYSSGLMN